MPMRDSRPCDVTSGSSHSMNSAGRCNGMSSTNSGYSDDSMEHLSAEERACLMFLEETIESLEAEDNSAALNVNPDRSSRNLTNKIAHLSSVSQVKPQEISVHEDPNKVLGKDHKHPKFLVPTPLVLANGNAKLLRKTDFSTTDQKPAPLVNPPKTTALNPHQSSAVPTSANGTAVSWTAPNPGRHETNDTSSDLTDLPPSFIPKPPLSGSTAKDSPPKSNRNPRTDQKHKNVPSNMSMELLPPPSDFMDVPVFHPPVHTLPAGQSQPQTSTQLPSSQLVPQIPSRSDSMTIAPPPGFDGHVETNKPLTPLSTSPKAQLSPNDLDKLRKKASMKKAPEVVPVDPVKTGHNTSDQSLSSTYGLDTSSATVDYGEPKSPPIVAPKPKKLPSSIVLKSHKDPTPGHSLVSPGDRMMVNQQKVHQEALKKLGLLRGDEASLGRSPSPSHKTSPQTSFNISTSSELTAPSGFMHAEHHEVVETPEKTNLSFLPVHPEKGEKESLLITRTPSPKPFEMKSASMERTGVGLKNLTLENVSQLTGQEETTENAALPPGYLQNTRSQHASIGNWKDLSTDQIASESNKEREDRRSLHIPASLPPLPKVESQQKSVRSHGISVVISPLSNNGEDRKLALRRLGLIND